MIGQPGLKLLTLLSALVLLSGCPDDGDEGTPCDLNSDCEVEGQRCIDGQCAYECVENIDCGEGLVCENNRCAEPVTPCRADEDCPYANECVQGLCTPIEGFCLRNSDCQSGFVCSREMQVCVEEGSEVECITTGDCFAGEICVSNQCVPEPEPDCINANDCFADEICVGGECVPDTSPDCVRNDECGVGEVCSGGVCVDAGPECVRNSDCSGNLICAGGECRPECAVDRDCGMGEVCEQGRCERDTSGTSNGTTPDNAYSGQFRLSSNAGIQNCNSFLNIQYDAREVTAVQNGAAYTFIFPTSVYDGSLTGNSFQVSWSGFQQTTELCGDMNTANTYNGVFSSPDFFQGTLTSEFFFQVGSCNCTLFFPITGSRIQ